MKKLISAILVGVMILSLTACGGDTGNGQNSDSISASNSSGSGSNSLTEAFAEILIRTAQIFHLLLAVISNRQNRRKALKLLDLLRNQNHPKLSSFIRCYP